MRYRLCRAAAVVLVAGTSGSSALSQTPPAETIALTGREDALGPGLGAGVRFSAIGGPTINASGVIVSVGTLTGTGITTANNTLIFTGSPGGLRTIARRGAPAPGTSPGVVLAMAELLGLTLNASGRVVFYCDLAGTGVTTSNYRALWTEAAGTLSLVARSGSAAPGVGGPNFTLVPSVLSPSALSDDGRISFTAALSGSGVNSTNDGTIWSGTPTPSLVAREGQAAPGLPAGVFFEVLNEFGIVGNAAGSTLVAARLDGTDVGLGNDNSIWLATGANLQMLVRDGQLADGAGTQTFVAVDSPYLSDSGAIIFSAAIGNGTISGIWTATTQGNQLVVLEDAQVPGMESGVTFFDLRSAANPVMNADGRVAFRARIAGPNVNTSNNFGIWSGFPNAIELIARMGDAPPGVGPEIVYAQLGAIPGTTHRLNAQGQVLFQGTLTGAGVNNTNQNGAWLWTPGRGAELVVRTGDTLACADGVTRTISAFAIVSPNYGVSASPTSGVSSALADNGWVCYAAQFTDGVRGVFRRRVEAGCDSCCPADLDDGTGAGVRDGAVTIEDLLFALVRFEAGDLAIDLDDDGEPSVGHPDGAVTIEDLIFFLARFEQGC